ncbi:methyl-accepting chemotaxis protein [Aliiroseovarius sp. PTFE2010]|uniref:methyl-accepting chemotaxis protein n=1 Tax=Aliiroseovarius sp. PTFE2010 TaxID=3417190 RepID=UPI003CF1E05F
MRNLLNQWLHSVSAKISLILLAMSSTTAAAVLLSNVMLGNISDEVDAFSKDALPMVVFNYEIERNSGIVKDSLSAMLSMDEPEGLSREVEKATTALTSAHETAQELSGTEGQTLRALIDKTAIQLRDLGAARTEELSRSAAIASSVEQLITMAGEVSTAVEDAANDAYFDMMIGGNATMVEVEETLTNLVEEDFGALKTALAIRSEINFLSGIGIAIVDSEPRALRNTLIDLGNASLVRLSEAIPYMALNDMAGEQIDAVRELRDTLAVALGGDITSVSAFDFMDVRDQAAAILDPMTAALEDALVQHSEDAKARNASSIQSLLDEQVQALRDLALLDASVKDFLSAALEIAAAPSIKDVSEKQEHLLDIRSQVLEGATTLLPDLQAKVTALLAASDPGVGIAADRTDQIEAHKRAIALAASAVSTMQSMSDFSGNMEHAAISDITQAAYGIETMVSEARSMMQMIGIAALVLFVLAPIITYVMIARPLGRVTRTTERLAQGDKSEITGLDRAKGEIGRMASALRVFRTNLIEKEQLDANAKATEKARHEAERLAAEKERQREDELRAEDAAREAQERARVAAELAERDRMRREADEERQAHMAAQAQIVSTLAGALKRLAAGDLRTRITEEFGEGYEQLRLDFNEAVETLDDVIARITDSSETVFSNSGEITQAAGDMSRRTEQAASALGETAAALTQLTSSVQSAAEGAEQADKVVATTRSNAEKSSVVVRQAVDAMGQIEQSSQKISTIISLIDDIAFQTNLLALNAGVEAARAGEAGSGFAVVASEVRALAQRSSDAAHEISILISESGQHVAEGVSLVDEAGDALETIVHEVSKISGLVSTIATSAKEQSTGISEINSSVYQLDQTTQQNAAMFEQTNAASQSLTHEASVLQDIVGRFTNSSTAGAAPSNEDQAGGLAEAS